MTKPPINAAGPLPLLCVLALALALRLWGITWGLPSETHYFSYHPDESVVLMKSSLVMNVFAGRLLPHYYNYGSLQLYFVCFANTLGALFGGVEIVPRNFAQWYPQWAKMYLIGRCVTVGMGVGTVWTTYAIGATLWSRRAGLVAAFVLAITPLHVQHSHFLTVDIPATFWVMLSLLWSARLATDTPKPLRAALFAGLFAGLAAATKYNMALAILPLLVAACLREPTLPRSSVSPPETGRAKGGEKGQFQSSSPSRFGRVSVGGLLRTAACAGVGLFSCILAFFAACPGALLESDVFLKDFRFEAVHVQNVDDPTFRNTGNGFVYHITHNLDAGLGLPLLLLALVSVGYALYRRERGDALLAAFALPYYVLISLAAVRYARYTIPLLPILALWVGRMLTDGSRLPQASWRKSSLVVAAACFAMTVLNTSVLLSAMTGQDTRDQALMWLNNQIPASAQVRFAVQPWFGDVPLSPYFTLPGVGAWRSVTPPEVQQRIVYTGRDWDVAALRSKKPKFVALSEFDYDDAMRLHNSDTVAYIAELKRSYHDYRIFSSPRLFSDAEQLYDNLPHDMTYPSPNIIVFGRSNNGDNLRH